MTSEEAGLSWREAAELSDTELEARLFSSRHVPGSVHRPAPDRRHIYWELRQYHNRRLPLTQL